MSNRDGWKRDPDNAPIYLPSREVRANGRAASRHTTAAERSHASDPRRAYVKGGVRRGI